MNNALYHLIVFLALLIFFAVLIVTGHDNSPLLTTILGGALGGSGASAVGPALAAFFRGPSDPTASAPVTRQAGFFRVGFLAFLMIAAVAAGVSACATLTGTTSDNTAAVAEACAGTSATIKSLTIVEQAGQLSAADVQAVTAAVAVVTPICEAPTAPTVTAATLTAITGAAAQLTTLQLKYHATPTGS